MGQDKGQYRTILDAMIREVKTAQIRNPVAFKAELYTRKTINDTIVKTAYPCQLVDVGGIPYKIISQEGDVATCQELTSQEMADLMERYSKVSKEQK